MSELNQQVVSQPQVDDNNTQGQGQQVVGEPTEPSLFSNEDLASERSQARNEFFASMNEEDIERALQNASNGIPLPGSEEPQPQPQSEPNLEERGQDNGLLQSNQDRNGLQEQGQKEEVKQETNDSSLLGGDKKQDEAPQQQEQPKVETYTIKSRNKEYSFNIDELKQMASKGIDYTQKLQKIAPFRKMINAIEANNISETDINQLIEMKKGNKDAIGAFTKAHNIALSDIESGEANAANYKPQQYGQEPSPLQDIDLELRGSMQQMHYQKMIDFVNNADTQSQQFFIDNPDALYILASNVEDGSFDRVINEVEKQSYLNASNNRIPLIDRYRQLWLKMNNTQNVNIAPNTSSGNVVSNQQSNFEQQNKDKLGLTGTNNVAIKDEKVINMLDDITDEEFERFFKEKMGTSFSSY